MDGEFENGNFQSPIVIEGITFDSEQYHQEYFGPVFCLYRVTSVQEALEYANQSQFGHAATVFSESPNYCRQMSLKLRVGLVHLNHTAYITSEFPSGGIKDSGFGSSSYSDGLTNLSNRKSVVNKVW